MGDTTTEAMAELRRCIALVTETNCQDRYYRLELRIALDRLDQAERQESIEMARTAAEWSEATDKEVSDV